MSNGSNKDALEKEHVNFDMNDINAQVLPEEDSPSLKDSNEFRSAGVFMKSIADEAWSWRKSLPDGFQPSILAILESGFQIDVLKLSQVCFHGIRVKGTMNGSACVMFAHQANIQILCRATKIEKDTSARPIGSIWPDKEIQI
ncbi:MAG: hypothetical protein A6F71_06460 [Cycloclasticus sp. symbiont of Poecilosclerida sp. M]|nr:MAG: hypothetical protein A6F71_06460 [Cycloclasticus sp. symbiont of Poecilosclerida sp. M]